MRRGRGTGRGRFTLATGLTFTVAAGIDFCFEVGGEFADGATVPLLLVGVSAFEAVLFELSKDRILRLEDWFAIPSEWFDAACGKDRPLSLLRLFRDRSELLESSRSISRPLDAREMLPSTNDPLSELAEVLRGTFGSATSEATKSESCALGSNDESPKANIEESSKSSKDELPLMELSAWRSKTSSIPLAEKPRKPPLSRAVRRFWLCEILRLGLWSSLTTRSSENG